MVELRRSASILSIAVLALVAIAVLWIKDGSGDRVNSPSRELPSPKSDDSEPAPTAGRARDADRGSIDVRSKPNVAIPRGILDDRLFRSGLGSVRGRVTDESGRPVSGVVVECRMALRGLRVQGEEHRRVVFPWDSGSAVSSADGRFVIASLQSLRKIVFSIGGDRNWGLSIVKKPWEVSNDFVVPPGDTLDIGDLRVVPCSSIRGTVLDPSGEPCAGAVVRVFSAWRIAERRPMFSPSAPAILGDEQVRSVVLPGPLGHPWRRVHRQAISGENGAFQVSGVRPGSWQVAVQIPGAFAPISRHVACTSGGFTDAGEFRLKGAHALRCRVVDPDGRDIAAAELLAIGPSPDSTGIRWNFGVRVTSRDGGGFFAVQGYGPDRVTFAARRPGQAWTITEALNPAKPHTITLPKACELRVAVTDAEGRRVEHPEFRLRAADRPTRARMGFPRFSDNWFDLRKCTAAIGTGEWRFSLSPGKYRLLASDPGRGLAKSTVLDIDRSNAIEIDLAAARRVRVQATDDRTQPIEFAQIAIDNMPVGWTDANGEFFLDATGLTDVSISVDHPAFDSEPRELSESIEDIRFTLRPFCTVEGRLRVRAGTPRFAAWRITCHSTDENRFENHTVRVSADGLFRLALRAPGTYEIDARDGLDRSADLGFPNGVATIDVASGKNAPLELVVDWRAPPPATKLHGVVSIDGHPARGLLVVTEDSLPIERGTTTTDERGRFDLGGVYRKALTLSVERPSTIGSDVVWSRELEFDNSPTHEARTRELRIDLMTGSLSGRVLGLDGSSAVGERVYAEGRLDRKGKETCSLSVVTDLRGEFEFKSLISGHYYVHTTGSTYGGLVRDLTVRPGRRTQDVRVRLARAIAIQGSVDLTKLGITGHSWAELRVIGPSDQTVEIHDSSFSVTNVIPGRYRVVLRLGANDADHDRHLEIYHDQAILIDAQGLADPVIRFDRDYLVKVRRFAKRANRGLHSYLKSMGLRIDFRTR